MEEETEPKVGGTSTSSVGKRVALGIARIPVRIVGILVILGGLYGLALIWDVMFDQDLSGIRSGGSKVDYHPIVVLIQGVVIPVAILLYPVRLGWRLLRGRRSAGWRVPTYGASLVALTLGFRFLIDEADASIPHYLDSLLDLFISAGLFFFLPVGEVAMLLALTLPREAAVSNEDAEQP